MMTDWIKKVDAMDAANCVLADAKEHDWNGVEAICLMKNSLLGMADAELAFLKEYVLNMENTEVCWEQLRALWTAFCFHHGFNVDTLDYDEAMHEVWTEMPEDFRGTLDDLDLFLCRYLV